MAGRGRKAEDKVVISNRNDHDYADTMEVCVEANKRLLDDCSAEDLPVTPSKVHITKKMHPDYKEDISNADILEAIYSLSKRFDKQEEKLEELTRKMEESSVISEMKEDMKTHKQKAAELELELSDLKKENKELRSRVGELDRYKRRWNLRIKGLPEKQNENTREEVITLLSTIAPGVPWEMEEALDMVHRIGRKEGNRTRQIIMQFSKRIYREQIWALSKGSSVCKEAGCHFAEDLNKEDREARQVLWPRIKQARAEGKAASSSRYTSHHFNIIIQ
ncbi:cytoplasmic dynein 2 heavy chain 1-like [Sinocyclocheilus anshuiensis]|uniref:cytoplasmic dynein 2 heavy chain 1-like n=1 Tax=Sinocyclocheilus anshuiensis TaxID=1608454 RepID=UPI0007BADBB2|nr:PREDICTED: cytoplasmic dynein 2 heavy chain 1-like [Sinocyclocheilus anshuiensis]